ncbi:MAG: hypothetical protein APF76_04315 [Desulfitibacter sp. BRH_c19]|nr:MAG: hypothetical protein APF76_04315 [Desulfitibacter sp. BRH_c19]
MRKDLDGLTITMVYGDKRDIYLAKRLIEINANLLLVGFDRNEVALNFKELKRVQFFQNLIEPAKKTDIFILPIPGVDNQGFVKTTTKNSFQLTQEVVKSFKSHTLILVGIVSPYLLDLKEQHNLNLIETAELNDLSILNSIPSAEGALAKAMELTKITIHNSNSMVIGFGRVGITLARMLKGLGANTFVAARNIEQLARALEMNCHVLDLNDIEKKLQEMDIIFNTVPALILPKERLKLLNKNCVIIDLASAPGGLDYNAADELGIRSYLAPGLPGRVAPITAGNILGTVYPRVIIDYISKGRGGVTNVC